MLNFQTVHQNNTEKVTDGKTVVFLALVYLLIFQRPLETVWPGFSYIDEAVALLGVVSAFDQIVIKRKSCLPKYMLLAYAFLAVFFISGLLGNILFQYQPWKWVIVDIYTNFKFFFAILTGYLFFFDLSWEKLKKTAAFHGKLITGFLFAFFLLDRVFQLYPGEIRHGIRSARLFFIHSTYFAGAVAFLLCFMTIFYDKKTWPFLVMGVIMIVFTLRSKAMASAALFCVIFVLIIVLKLKVKLWHLTLLGGFAVLLGWPQIEYYFIALSGSSARSVMLITSFLIMKDYFPIGTGFGTYASSAAEKCYSPVYLKYGFNDNMELRNINDWENTYRLIEKIGEEINKPKYINGVFLNDTFWPIIFGQSGVIGTVAYVGALLIFFKKCFEAQKVNRYCFAAMMYLWAHLIISSIAEPAFNNAMAIPFAMMMGIVWGVTERYNNSSLGKDVML